LPSLLIGCGNRRIKKLSFAGQEWDGLVTLDHDPNCGADIVHDLESLPWPVEADSFDEVHAYEVLEHLGEQGDYKAFFAQFAEIYRVLKPGGLLFATVPAWDDIWAWSDPSHRRIITKGTLVFLDQTEYVQQVGKTAMTDFRWLWQGDFETMAGETENGSFKFALKAHKPARH
jgi:predicted SAM-dependent methyltransferase